MFHLHKILVYPGFGINRFLLYIIDRFDSSNNNNSILILNNVKKNIHEANINHLTFLTEKLSKTIEQWPWPLTLHMPLNVTNSRCHANWAIWMAI
jgi:hypothetical protein